MDSANTRRVDMFVFIDAFGWELMKRHEFLDDVLTVKSPLNTIFGYSSTCDPTILTGAMPREHEHFSFFRYDPSASPFTGLGYRMLGLLPKSVTSRGRVRHRISGIVQKRLGYTGYFQLYNVPFKYLHLFDYSEKRDLYLPNGINGGQPVIFDHLREINMPYYLSDWRHSEGDNLAALQAVLRQGDIRFAYLYLASMDAVLHQYGTAGVSVTEKIGWYQRQLRAVLTVARRHYGRVNIHVFSDHGMTDVQSCSGLMADIDALGLKFGRDYAAMYDSTMARFWFLNESARQQIIGALVGRRDGDILSKSTLAEWGCDFADNLYGELFFLLRPGVLLCPSFMGAKPLAGMHGYAPDDVDSVAGYASNVTSADAPRRLDDLYGLMRQAADENMMEDSCGTVRDNAVAQRHADRGRDAGDDPSSVRSMPADRL